MARPRKKPDYDPDKIMNDLLDIVVEEYKKALNPIEGKGEIKTIAAELDIAPHKARKLLITAGVRDGEEYYSNANSKLVLTLHTEGKSVDEIMSIIGLNRTSVCCYLPYSKGLYNAKELSLDAERIRRYRRRQELCAGFMEEIKHLDESQAEGYLWEMLSELEGCIFHTLGHKGSKGLAYRYKMKDGEMFIDRKEKSVTRSTVMLSFHRAMELQDHNGFVSGPKQLGTFGASYLYPIYLRLGICSVTDRRSEMC